MPLILLVGDHDIRMEAVAHWAADAGPGVQIDVFDPHPDVTTWHPDRFGEIVNRLGVAASIVVTNHPYFVDLVPMERVWCLAKGERLPWGARLSDHPDADRWGGQLSAGEFWSSVGEAWVPECPQALRWADLAEAIRKAAVG